MIANYQYLNSYNQNPSFFFISTFISNIPNHHSLTNSSPIQSSHSGTNLSEDAHTYVTYTCHTRHTLPSPEATFREKLTHMSHTCHTLPTPEAAFRNKKKLIFSSSKLSIISYRNTLQVILTSI